MATVDKQLSKETIKKAVEQARQKPKKEEPKAQEKKEEKRDQEKASTGAPPSEQQPTLSALVEDTIIKQDTAKTPKLEELLPKYQSRDNAQKKDYQPAQGGQPPPNNAYQRPGERPSPANAYNPKSEAYEGQPGQAYRSGHEDKKDDAHRHHDPLAEIIEGYKR